MGEHRRRGCSGRGVSPQSGCDAHDHPAICNTARCRYSTLFTAFSPDLGCDVVIKVYDKPGASAKKLKMCRREATMLQFVTAQG